MLSATLSFPPTKNGPVILGEFDFSNKNNRYVYYQKDRKLIEASLDSNNHSLKLMFSPGLNLEEYTLIQTIIVSLMNKLDATINDKDSLLGYTSTGAGSYIVTNWEKWFDFLQKAKLTSLEGKKVRIIDEHDKELGAGLFVGYKTEEPSSTIIESTIITLFGERTFHGKNLTIQPTNEW